MATKLNRFCSGIMEAAWLAAVIIIPVFFNIYSSRIFEPDKITILRSLALLSLAAWFIKLIDEGGRNWKRQMEDQSLMAYLWHFPMIAPVLGMIIVYVISTIFSVTPSVSLFGSYQRLQGTYTTFSYLVIFISIISNMRTRSQINRFITTVILASLPVSLYGLLQKYQIDPIPWGGNVTVRIASNMGNSIFVAAYLIMVFPMTTIRMVGSFKDILVDGTGNGSVSNSSRHIVRATIYVFIAALELIAIYMSGSRGPMLGLFAGSYLLSLLLSIYWQKRWLTYGIVGLAILGTVFLAVFNINNGPIDSLKKSPAIGRFGKLLDPESNSALVRQYIWEGVVNLVGIHEPLKYPDGSSDIFNIIRPLIGYGPESMYVAYNQFYQPDLGRVEKRNASPDRSHNETWDAIVITGFAGLFIYLATFFSIFYYGLKWQRLITNTKQKYFYFFCVISGGFIGAVIFIFLKGIEFLGVGLPFGMLIGIVLYLTTYAIIFSNKSLEPIHQNKYGLLIIGLFAALIGHFVEINFGIAIAVTRTLFWSFAGVLIVVGYIVPRSEQIEVNNHPTDGRIKQLSQKQKKSKRSESKLKKIFENNNRPSIGGYPDTFRNALIGAFIISILLITFGYIYIMNTAQNISIISIIVESLTRLKNKDNVFSLGVLALVALTWIVSVVLFTVETETELDETNLLQSGILVAGGSAITGFVFWILHSISLAVLAGFSPNNQNDVITQVNNIGSLLTKYYIYILIIIILAAFILPEKWSRKGFTRTSVNLILAPLSIIILFISVNITNLQVVHADITFKMAEPFTKNNQWQIATFLYKHALDLAPREDHYYLFLGRSYLEQAKNTQGTQDQDNLVQQAENDLLVAQDINPLNTDHTANLARLYSWWASKGKTIDDIQSRGQKASQYYATAVILSPNNSTLWDEWAVLYMQVLGQADEAFARLQHAMALDNQYSFTLGLFGDYYTRMGNAANDERSKITALETAAEYYQQASASAKKTEATSKAAYLISLGNTYLLLDDLDTQDVENAYLKKAAGLLVTSSSAGINANEQWKIQEMIARIYYKLGDKVLAKEYASLAYSNAPESTISRIQELIDQIDLLR